MIASVRSVEPSLTMMNSKSPKVWWQDALQGLLEILLLVEHRHDDADFGTLHSAIALQQTFLHDAPGRHGVTRLPHAEELP